MKRALPHLRFTGLVLTLVGSLHISHATEAGRPLSRVYLPEDYRGFEQVWDFAQTADGLLYATNYGALREFDGRAWRTIPLPTSWVQKVCAAPDGRLYIAGFDEIGMVVRAADGRREYRPLTGLVPESARPLGQVYQALWHRGSIFWATASRVIRWDGAAMRVWSFEAPLRLKLHHGGTFLYVDEGAVALHRFDDAADDFAVLSRDPALCTLAQGVFDAWAHHGSVVVRGNGSIVAFDDSGRVEKLDVASERPELSRRVIATARLADDRLAIGTVGHGLFLVSPDGRVDLRFGLHGGIGSPDIHGILPDREGGLWLGTAHGLARLEPSTGISIFDRTHGAPPGVSYSVFRHHGAVHSRGDDGLYRLASGSDGGPAGFVRLEGPNFNANDFATHPSGLIIATNIGLLRHDGTRLVSEFETHHSLHVVEVSGRDQDLLFFGDSQTLRTARWDGTAWREADTIAAVQMDVRSIVEADDGSLWLGTPTRGIFRLARRDDSGSWHDAVLTPYGLDRGLPEGHEWTTVRATPHGIVFVHSRGVSVHDATADRLVPAGAFDAVGRNGRYIYAFTHGADGTLWVQVGDPTRGERAELGGVVPQPGGGWKWQPLPARASEALGFLGAQELNWEPGPAGGRGVLWAAGQSALVRIDLSTTLTGPRAPAPAVVLRDITLGDALRLPIDGAGPAHLDFTREALALGFAAPLFSATGPVEYQHRLLGFNDAWSAWSDRREATYTNLPPGALEFQVRARAAGGEPGPAAVWRFVVHPPWWRSEAALLLYAAAAALVFMGALRWRLAAARRERTRLEQLVAQRTDELEQERDRAEEASQAKTMFLARMSHELRTPLHAILGYSRMLAADTTVPPAARDRLRVVRASGQHLLGLINEVLDLSKIEAGKQELRVEPFDLEALLQETGDAQEARAALKGLAFRREGALPARHVLGDAPKLRQVLDNLLGNATKFTAAGEVVLTVAPGGPGRTRFAVRDTGPGIEAEEQERIFQPFAQARTAARTRESGTGLGLAISQRLVALMGGRLEVESSPGHGSTFSFEIPLAAAPAPAPAARVRRTLTGYVGPGRRVLAVDDVEANRALFVDLLQPLGFDVATATTAEEALEKLDTLRPDLLLLDLRLPGMDGFELARRIRSDPRHEGMKILAASASVLGHDPREALAAGCDGFIPKPFLEDEFLALVGELLGLTWRESTPAAGPRDIRPDPATLDRLHAAARAGDVVAMRAAVARLRELHGDAPAVDEIESALRDFDTDRLARLAVAMRSPAS